jgi:Predicted membrane protein
VPSERPGGWRNAGFLAGLAASYAFLQTRLDYLAQHMFWIHRMQHLVLHHVAPFVIALSAPTATLGRGAPRWLMRGVIAPLLHNRMLRLLYRTIQNPLVASVLFTGLIVFWLTPSIHFKAMLSLARYDAMNWSMLIDGLLFWWLIVGPEHRGAIRAAGLRYAHADAVGRDAAADRSRRVYRATRYGAVRRLQRVRAGVAAFAAHRPEHRRPDYLDSGCHDERGRGAGRHAALARQPRA